MKKYILMSKKISVILIAFFLIGCSNDKTTLTDNPGTDSTTVPFLASDFSSAETCKSCHPQHFDEWSGSMHAYAVKNPTWLRLREIGQSQYINALDGACSPCHSPIGLRSGDIKWGPLDVEALDPVSREGVGCDLCHTITGITRLSNGGIDFAPSDTKQGTIKDPVSNPFHTSKYNDLYAESEYCGSCHNLKNSDGVAIENIFGEWRAGGFAVTGKTCSDCHMETYTGPAAVDGPDRTLHRHDFVGVDFALTPFPNRDKQMARVIERLQSALSMTTSAQTTATAGQNYSFDVQIINDKTWHNVPAGTSFNRQMWLSIIVKDSAQNVIFSSGQLDANDDLMDRYSEFPERDSSLFNAQATLFKADGTEASLWDAATISNPSIVSG